MGVGVLLQNSLDVASLYQILPLVFEFLLGILVLFLHVLKLLQFC